MFKKSFQCEKKKNKSSGKMREKTSRCFTKLQPAIQIRLTEYICRSVEILLKLEYTFQLNILPLGFLSPTVLQITHIYRREGGPERSKACLGQEML